MSSVSIHQSGRRPSASTAKTISSSAAAGEGHRALRVGAPGLAVVHVQVLQVGRQAVDLAQDRRQGELHGLEQREALLEDEALEQAVEVLGVRAVARGGQAELLALLAQLGDRVDLAVVAEDREGLHPAEGGVRVGRVAVVGDDPRRGEARGRRAPGRSAAAPRAAPAPCRRSRWPRTRRRGSASSRSIGHHRPVAGLARPCSRPRRPAPRAARRPAGSRPRGARGRRGRCRPGRARRPRSPRPRPARSAAGSRGRRRPSLSKKTWATTKRGSSAQPRVEPGGLEAPPPQRPGQVDLQARCRRPRRRRCPSGGPSSGARSAPRSTTSRRGRPSRVAKPASAHASCSTSSGRPRGGRVANGTGITGICGPLVGGSRHAGDDGTPVAPGCPGVRAH